MFHRSVKRIPVYPSSASFSHSFCARCLCHSSGSRSNVAGFRSSTGKKSLADFSLPVAGSPFAADTPPTLEVATAAPVVARNSLRLIMAVASLLGKIGAPFRRICRQCAASERASLWPQRRRSLRRPEGFLSTGLNTIRAFLVGDLHLVVARDLTGRVRLAGSLSIPAGNETQMKLRMHFGSRSWMPAKYLRGLFLSRRQHPDATGKSLDASRRVTATYDSHTSPEIST